MGALTSGYVAGIIAFLVVIVKILFPTALSFILAGELKDEETAGTWTVAAKSLQASYWSNLLKTDASQSHGVRGTVKYLTMALPALAILVAITGVVTPLGLYEKDMEDSNTKTPPFVYAGDSTPFGAGTSARAGEPYTRGCRHQQCAAPCPFTTDVRVVTDDDYTSNCESGFELNATVPEKLHAIYQSGTSSSRTTISSFFDIGWRQLTNTYDEFLNDGDPVAAGAFRYLESFSLYDDYRAVEGLVVDSKNGAIGFRNHTLPENQGNGATWSEDLLFLEPDVYCVENNITVDFNVAAKGDNLGGVTIKNLTLVDHGAFVNINTTNPMADRHGKSNKPDLQTRAYIAAWTTNALFTLTLNVSNPEGVPDEDSKAFSYINSEVGKEFELPDPEYDDSRFRSLDILQNMGYYFGFSLGNKAGSKKFKNPWNVTYDEFETGRFLCEGVRGSMPAELNNTFVSCTMVRGVPRRVDDSRSMIFDDGSRWSSPIHTCASAIKATVKTATFFHNGTTDSIDNLSVKELKEKEYPDIRSMPLWGVENWSFKLGEFDPVWGLVDGAYENSEDVTTIRQPYLYLLGSSDPEWSNTALTLRSFSAYMNLPGTIAPLSALKSISTNRDGNVEDVADLSGQNSMSLWMKWRGLSESASTTPKVIKLLWTDLAASAMVGTKGVLGAGNARPDEAVEISVRPMVHRVMYNYAYAVPACVTLFCMLVMLIALIVSMAQGRASVKVMDQRLKQTSNGRSLTTLLNPGMSSFIMPSKDWSAANGHRMMSLGSGAAGEIDVDNAQGMSSTNKIMSAP